MMIMMTQEKTMEHDDDSNFNRCARNNPERFSKRTRSRRKQRTRRHHSHNCINKIGHNTEKSPGDLRSLKLPWKTISRPWCEKLSRRNNNNKKKICKIVDYAVPIDHKIKLKESEKRDKYLDLENWKNYGVWRWQLYKLWLVLLVQ